MEIGFHIYIQQAFDGGLVLAAMILSASSK
jgi:hypothetical protein